MKYPFQNLICTFKEKGLEGLGRCTERYLRGPNLSLSIYERGYLQGPKLSMPIFQSRGPKLSMPIFLLRFQMVFDTMLPFVRISNGWASGFQIPFEIHTSRNSTFVTIQNPDPLCIMKQLPSNELKRLTSKTIFYFACSISVLSIDIIRKVIF